MELCSLKINGKTKYGYKQRMKNQKARRYFEVVNYLYLFWGLKGKNLDLELARYYTNYSWLGGLCSLCAITLLCCCDTQSAIEDP